MTLERAAIETRGWQAPSGGDDMSLIESLVSLWQANPLDDVTRFVGASYLLAILLNFHIWLTDSVSFNLLPCFLDTAQFYQVRRKVSKYCKHFPSFPYCAQNTISNLAISPFPAILQCTQGTILAPAWQIDHFLTTNNNHPMFVQIMKNYHR